MLWHHALSFHYQITLDYQENDEVKCDESNKWALLCSDLKTQVGDKKKKVKPLK